MEAEVLTLVYGGVTAFRTQKGGPVCNENRFDILSQAIEHLQAALSKLDEAQAPAQIGAYVDLALCQLNEAVVSTGTVPQFPPIPGATEH